MAGTLGRGAQRRTDHHHPHRWPSQWPRRQSSCGRRWPAASTALAQAYVSSPTGGKQLPVSFACLFLARSKSSSRKRPSMTANRSIKADSAIDLVGIHGAVHARLEIVGVEQACEKLVEVDAALLVIRLTVEIQELLLQCGYILSRLLVCTCRGSTRLCLRLHPLGLSAIHCQRRGDFGESGDCLLRCWKKVRAVLGRADIWKILNGTDFQHEGKREISVRKLLQREAVTGKGQECSFVKNQRKDPPKTLVSRGSIPSFLSESN
jgi:hypothetical protein